MKTWQQFAVAFVICFAAFAGLLPLTRSVDGPVRWVAIAAVGAITAGILIVVLKALKR